MCKPSSVPTDSRKRLERSRQDRSSKLDESHLSDESACCVMIGAGKTACVHSVPEFIFQQPARNLRLAPQSRRRRFSFTKEVRKGDGAIEIDQRSSRSRCKSAISSSNDMTGPARGRCARGDRGGRQPPFPNTFGDQVVVAQQPAARLWRNNLGNNAIAISNQHGFAGPSDAHILAKLVLESFEPDRTHEAEGSFWKLLRQAHNDAAIRREVPLRGGNDNTHSTMPMSLARRSGSARSGSDAPS